MFNFRKPYMPITSSWSQNLEPLIVIFTKLLLLLGWNCLLTCTKRVNDTKPLFILANTISMLKFYKDIFFLWCKLIITVKVEREWYFPLFFHFVISVLFIRIPDYLGARSAQEIAEKVISRVALYFICIEMLQKYCIHKRISSYIRFIIPAI